MGSEPPQKYQKKFSLLRSTLKFFHRAIYTVITQKTRHFELANFGFAEPVIYLFVLSIIFGGMAVYSNIRTSVLWNLVIAFFYEDKINDPLTIAVSFLVASILIFLVILTATLTVAFILARIFKIEVRQEEFSVIAVSMTYLFMVFLTQQTILLRNIVRPSILNFILFNTALFLNNFLILNLYMSSFDMKDTKERLGLFLTVFLGFAITSKLASSNTIRDYILDGIAKQLLLDPKVRKQFDTIF